MNNIMEAYDSPEFKAIHNEADLVTPDGMPLVWGLRLLGLKHATRVYGPDLTPALLSAAELNGIFCRVLWRFRGSSQQTTRSGERSLAKAGRSIRVLSAFPASCRRGR